MSTIRTTNVRNEASATNNLALDASGNVTIGNNLTVTGTTTQTGVVVLPAGAVGAPSLTTTGDTDTGIFFPAANTIGFATNGTEDARFDSVGNLLLNSATLSPTQTAAGSIAMTGTLAMGSSFLRNRIINGDMRIDQRNAGASVTITDTSAVTYTLDRWAAYGSQASKFSVQQNAASVTPPAEFTNYLGVTSLSAYTVGSGENFTLTQNIEGFNVADLAWGTANARTITISFWVRSSLTGTFGGSLVNSAVNRSYPFTYTISASNTWEQKSITVSGDTSGTWVTNNGVGLRVIFGLGVGSSGSGPAGSWAGVLYQSATGAQSVVGTNGATFYITGVQLEVGSVATPFERRQYGQELALCQRYFCKDLCPTGYAKDENVAQMCLTFPVTMRATPIVSATAVITITDSSANYTQSATNAGTFIGGVNGGVLNNIGNFTGLTAYRPYTVNISGFNNTLAAGAEL